MVGPCKPGTGQKSRRGATLFDCLPSPRRPENKTLPPLKVRDGRISRGATQTLAYRYKDLAALSHRRYRAGPDRVFPGPSEVDRQVWTPAYTDRQLSKAHPSLQSPVNGYMIVWA